MCSISSSGHTLGVCCTLGASSPFLANHIKELLVVLSCTYLLSLCTPVAEVGKVTLKSNGDEALSDESSLKSNSNEALNDNFP
jgi:hypothetical protein